MTARAASAPRFLPVGRTPPSKETALRAPRQIDLEDLIAEADTPDISVASAKARARTQRRNAAPPPPPTPAPRRIMPPFERQRAQLPAELEQAARQVLKDYLMAQVGERVTANYAPTVRGGQKRDMGSDIRDARTTIDLIRAQLGDDVMRDIEWFIAAVVTRADGTPMRFADSGAMIAPGKSPEAQRWAGYGALVRSLSVLAKFYNRQRALGKTDTPATPADKENMKQLLATLAERRRARNS